MPYSKEHKYQSREKILASASRLFPRRGYEAVSIDMLMDEAGLTRGAFYNHFSNKEEVYAEAIIYAALRSPISLEKAEGSSLRTWFDNTIGHYLSREHVIETPSPCPLAFLVTDIGQRQGRIRNTYTRVFKNLNQHFKKRLKTNKVRPETILSVNAMMIGAVAIARALDDEKTADRLLASCRETARELLNITENA